MATKKAINTKNLEALGAERLAALVIEICSGNAVAKRRVKLELASLKSPEEAAKEIRKRFSTIRRSTSFIDWQKRKALVDDLLSQKRAIMDAIAPAAPLEALGLMWEFAELAESIFERSDDGAGTISGVFRDAVSDLGRIASYANLDSERLAERILQALNHNGCGQYDNLIESMKDALGPEGIEHLKNKLHTLSKQLSNKDDTRLCGRI